MLLVLCNEYCVESITSSKKIVLRELITWGEVYLHLTKISYMQICFVYA